VGCDVAVLGERFPMLRRTLWTAGLLNLIAISCYEISVNLCSDVASNPEDPNRNCSDIHGSAVY
jgi:hypothetical protein